MIRSVRLLAALAVLALGAAACNGAATEQAEPTPAAPTAEEAPATTEEAAATTPEATTPEATTPEPTATEVAGGVTVQVAESDLGEILVDGEGMTLYLFEQDSEGTSACYDDCAATWPPLEGEPTAGEGVDESLLGTIERDDGITQVTYDGQPLYYYAPDEAPGDTNGQGIGDVWFVVSPEGEAVTSASGGGLEY